MSAATELAKKVAYRIPVLAKWLGPRYRYKITPSQLAFLCDAITETKESGGAILEIGVAKGDTSAFLLEHMASTGDTRTIYFLDTFSGFSEDSIEHEVKQRGKDQSDYGAFRYGDEKIFANNLSRLGYTNFKTVRGDASALDYSQFGPIAVVLLDIDLYKPTKAILEKLWDKMTTPGFICVDDCKPDKKWDGSLAAYNEFMAARQLPTRIVGGKGGVIIKKS
jgi:hypothetical protein